MKFLFLIIVFDLYNAEDVTWPADFLLSYDGKIPGYDCVHLTEPKIRRKVQGTTQYSTIEVTNNYAWFENYICTVKPIGLKWSNTVIPFMKCTNITNKNFYYESTNYLCLPLNSSFNFIWKSKVGYRTGNWSLIQQKDRVLDGLQCMQWMIYLPTSYDADYYLCHVLTSGDQSLHTLWGSWTTEEVCSSNENEKGITIRSRRRRCLDGIPDCTSSNMEVKSTSYENPRCQGTSWPYDFTWSFDGKIPGYTCIRIYYLPLTIRNKIYCNKCEHNERFLRTINIIDRTWFNNYFCTKNSVGIKWSTDGAISGMRCTFIPVPLYGGGLKTVGVVIGRNYICVPNNSKLNFTWSAIGKIKGMECMKWYEPNEGISVQDTIRGYLCAYLTVITRSTAKVPEEHTEHSDISYVLALAIIVPILLIILILFVLFVLRKKTIRNQKSFMKIKGGKVRKVSRERKRKDKWEILSKEVECINEIGHGAFGKVFLATIKPKAFQRSTYSKKTSTNYKHYAVKYLNDEADEIEKLSFKTEIDLMKKIGFHPNVLNMVGCETLNEPYFLVVEYMPCGDLLDYLRQRRTHLKRTDSNELDPKYFEIEDENLITGETDTNKRDDDELTTADLMAFSYQIAYGMEYLASIDLVHRDLAARNILVGKRKEIKISDFGLTRFVNDDLVYNAETKRRLPIKWMSIEALFDGVFTTYSDVWSYGIVLFEITTIGGSPYPGLSNREVLPFLKSGHRLEKPDNCDTALYTIIKSCWEEDPHKRPTFKELTEKFENMLEKDYVNLNVDENKSYYQQRSFMSDVEEHML